jgi:hypothetical protein
MPPEQPEHDHVALFFPLRILAAGARRTRSLSTGDSGPDSTGGSPVGSLAAGDSQFRWRSWLIAVVKEGRAGVLPFLAFAPGVTANNQH